MADRSILVYGAGAVGGYLGATLRLGNPNLAVTLIGREPLVEAVRERGLIVRGGEGEKIARLQAESISSSGLTYDLVILAVRTFDVARSIEDVRGLIGTKGQVLAVQNGVGTEEDLAEALGWERVLIGTLTVSVGMEEPAVITRYSRSGGVALSTMSGASPPHWLVEAFQATGLPTAVIPDYRALRWSKLLLNMLGAPISAILDMDNAELVANPALFRLEQQAFREAAGVMDAQGITVVPLPGYPVPLARALMRLPSRLARRVLGPRIAGSRGGRSPTMRMDMRRGRSEVANLNGAVARAARNEGLSAPVNETLAGLTLELAEHPERREAFRGKPERLTAYVQERGG